MCDSYICLFVLFVFIVESLLTERDSIYTYTYTYTSVLDLHQIKELKQFVSHHVNIVSDTAKQYVLIRFTITVEENGVF